MPARKRKNFAPLFSAVTGRGIFQPMPFGKTIGLAALIFCAMVITALSAEPGRKLLSGHVPAAVSRLVANGRLPVTNQLSLAIGLPLRNQNELDALIAQLYDPRSTNYHKYLTPPEFTARFGPTAAEYLAVQNFARTNGFTVIGTHGNRLVLDVQAKSGDAERAFHVTLKTFRHPSAARDFFAPDTEPSVPANLAVADIWGLSDYGLAHPLAHGAVPLKARAQGGSGPSGYFAGNDFRNAYLPGSPLNGAGQTVGLLQFSDYNKADITNYENMIGLTNFVTVTNVVLPGGTPSTANNNETCLDIEMAIAMCPQLSRVIVYEIKSVNPNSILSRMANDNLAASLSSSWSWSGGPSTSVDNALKQMITQGQSYFQASGDSDAYTGSQVLDNAGQTTSPMDSTNVICVGGTTLSMNGTGTSWSSETVWNYHIYGGANANVGSGGGISTYYAIPYWQTNLDTNTSQGSATFRNLPDVALTADGVSVCYTSGSSHITNGLAGTSCAAPLWAGFCALMNQQSVASGGTTVGFLNPAIYNLAATANYANCFHDITTGNNIGTNTAGLFNAAAGYDLATGLGTPSGTNLINALAPLAQPFFITQPASQIVTNGTTVTLNSAVLGAATLNLQWLLNGNNLSAGGNISGVNGNVLSITAATTNNNGNYSLVASNSYGAITSSIAVLNVGFAPAFSTSPTNLTLLSGSNATFTATVTGSATLAFQWLKNGTNISNGAGISGATTTNLALTAVTTNSSGNFSLSATNIYGATTSSVAVLTVVLPPAITSSSLTNRTLQCGGNTNSFTVTATGTAPLYYQWSLDGSPVLNATNTSYANTNLHLPNHTVGVIITNLYGSLASNATLTVTDTIAPVITLNGAAVLTNELGSVFTDPGATAADTCAGTVSVTTNGAVNINVVATNTLTYKAGDGNGNTNTVTRSVIIRDTTPPVISWSFTNLFIAANSNCVALMTNVTGTNYILATDLSGSVTNSQTPTNNAVLQLGTNVVVITVADASGNKSFSTNRIVVVDQTPPNIALNGNNPFTNELGSAFTDPGITFSDSCSGILTVTTNGTINISITGTNFLTYGVKDSSGNSNAVTRTVIVRDTTPPTILSSATNLVLAANANCYLPLPDVTGTNFILATDLSGALTITQSPTNGTILFPGTNIVVLTVKDASSNAAFATNRIIIQDQTPPVITLTGGNPVFSELGQPFTDPGATAVDSCVGAVAVTVSGFVNTNAVGTNTLTYTANDGRGNTNFALRSIIIRDTTPPTILWSFTNLIVAANSNCVTLLTNVTGTNFILATDLSGALTISQSPTNNFILPLGTNTIVITVADASGNKSYSTNTVVVLDQTPPQILAQPQSLTNFIGTTATFNFAATACTPLTFQWYSNNSLTIFTNSTLTLSNLAESAAGNYFAVANANGGATTSAVVTLTVNLYPPAISTGVFSFNGGLNLNLSGSPGHSYILEATTNLLPTGNWLPLATNTLGTNGVWSFTDSTATNIPFQFYRLKLAP